MTESAPRLVARNAASRVLGELFAKLGSLAFFVVMARRLGATGFGEFQFALALTGALTFIAGFGTDNLLAREVARKHERAGRLLADAVWIKVVAGVAMLLLAALIVNLADYTTQAREVVYIVGVGCLLEVISKSWFAVFQGRQRLEFASITLIAQRLVTAAMGIAVLELGGGVVGASIVYAAGSLLAIFTAEALLRHLGVRRAAVDWRGWLPLARTAVPIGMISLLAILLLRLDVTMLSFLGNANKVGVYSVAFRLVDATQFLGAGLAAAMLPWLARAERTGAIGVARGYSLGLKAISALLLPIGISVVLFARPAIRLLYGHGFDGAVLPMRLLGMMTLLYGINSYTGTSLTARDRPGAYARLIVPVIVQNIVCNLILIPRFGADGAAFDVLLSSSLLAVLALWQTKKVVGHSRFAGIFAGPVIAGSAMTALVLEVHLPWIFEAAIGFVVYTVVLGIFEWLTHRDDVRVFLRALPDRRGSRLRGDRTLA